MDKYYTPFKLEKPPLKESETGADEAQAIKEIDQGPVDQYVGPVRPIEPVLNVPAPVTYAPKPTIA